MFDLQLRSRLSSEKVRENLSSTTQPRKLLLKELQQTHMHTYILRMQTKIHIHLCPLYIQMVNGKQNVTC